MYNNLDATRGWTQPRPVDICAVKVDLDLAVQIAELFSFQSRPSGQFHRFIFDFLERLQLFALSELITIGSVSVGLLFN